VTFSVVSCIGVGLFGACPTSIPTEIKKLQELLEFNTATSPFLMGIHSSQLNVHQPQSEQTTASSKPSIKDLLCVEAKTEQLSQ